MEASYTSYMYILHIYLCNVIDSIIIIIIILSSSSKTDNFYTYSYIYIYATNVYYIIYKLSKPSFKNLRFSAQRKFRKITQNDCMHTVKCHRPKAVII